MRREIALQAIIVLSILFNVTTASAESLWVSPNDFNIVMIEGTTLTETLTIGNDSNENLNFILRSREISREIFEGLSGGGNIVSAVDVGGGNIVIEYEFSRPVINEEMEYDTVQVDGLETYQRTGAPIVPVRPATVLVPFGKTVMSIRVTTLDKQELPGTYLLPPGQEPYPLSYEGALIQTEPDPVIYGQGIPWPGIDYEEIATHSKRGYQLLLLNLFPVQYIPSTGKIAYTTRMLLEVELSDFATTGVLRPSTATILDLRKRVDNPNLLRSYANETIALEKFEAQTPLPGGGPYQYVIITNQALEGAPGPWNFQALRDAKITYGMTATIVTTEWIYSNYSGTRPDGGSDNQTRIRNFLIDAYQTWGTEYALLGGTNGIVPARMFRVDGENMPVDMYYGCVDPQECTFDGDADGVYGESNDGVGGGDVDLCAEIYVGRTAVADATELANFIKKTLAYSSTQEDYISLISMLGEYLGFGGVAEYAKPAMEQIRLGGDYDGYFTYGFENHTQPDFYDFDTSVNLYDADGDWPKSELIGLMNQGVHVFNHLGHANYTYDMKLRTSDLSSLTNTDYFFAYSQGCNPGGFDTTNCFAEVITTMEHGAFAVIMNARSGWGRQNSTDGPSQRFDRQFWDAVLDEDMLELGRANQDSKEDNLWDINGGRIRWCYYELNLFGDPAQKLRFEESCEWLTLEPENGTVSPAESNEISVTIDAMKLAPGLYEAEIIIVSNDPFGPTIVPVALTVNPDNLAVTPATGFDSTGTKGGPFEPACSAYTLTNNNPTESVNWTTEKTQDWFCIEPNQGFLGPSESLQIKVCISAEANTLEPNVYTDILIIRNTDSDSIKPRSISLTVKPPDCFTESFGGTGNDLENLMVTFMPDGSGAYYEACRDHVDEFPTDPNGGTYAELWDDDFAEVPLAGDKNILFYGTWYDRFYIGSNGYVTFGDGDIEFEGSLENHFIMPRISGFFADLTPQNNQCISYKLLEDRAAVTFEDVQLFGDKHSKNNFQIEMFYTDGAIRTTWLDINDTTFVVGLSRGTGIPPVFFQESDLSQYLPCWPWCDINKDYYVNLRDFAIFAKHWLEEDCSIPFWCGKADMDFSNIVDYNDLSICTEEWLTADEWWLQPLAHWKFDEGQGDIAYDLVGNNNGTLMNDPCWVAGKIGTYALDFDGLDDYVIVNDDDSLDFGPGDSFSFCIWLKFSTSDGGRITKRSPTTENGYGLFVNTPIGSAGRISFHTWSSGVPVKPGYSGGYNDSNWHFVCGVRDQSAGMLRLYIDGLLKDEVTETLRDLSNSRELMIGCSNSYGNFYEGQMDDVRLYGRALSAEEIEELYREGLGPKAFAPNPADGAISVDPNIILSWSAGIGALSHDVYLGTDYNDVYDANTSSPVYMGNFDINSYDPCGLEKATTYYWRVDELDDSNIYKGDIWSFTVWKPFDPNENLVSLWKFDEGQGDIAHDSAGSNHGSINGATWTTGIIGGALDFDGTSDYILVPDSDSISVGAHDHTLCAWIKPDNIAQSGGSASIVFSKIKDGDDKEYGFKINNGGYLAKPTEKNGNNQSAVTTTTPVTIGPWQHIAVTFKADTKEVAFYHNGIQQPHTSTITTLPDQLNDDLYIGRAGGTYTGGHFDGLMDNMRIYDRVLSAENIEELYSEGVGHKASAPNPADGVISVDPNTILSWTPGKSALFHDVYLGTDFNDVYDANTSSPVYMGNFDVNSYDPCGLETATTYYWRIDELDGSNIYKGNVWNFTTGTYFDPNLVSLWKFDEGQGDIAYDSVSNNNGTLMNDPCWVAGKIGSYALDFDGIDDYVEITDDNSLTPSDKITIAFWMYNRGGKDAGIYKTAACPGEPDSPGYSRAYNLRIESDTSKVRFAIHSSVNVSDYIDSNNTLDPNSWYHIAATFDQGQAKIYIDGMPDNSTTLSVSSIMNDAQPLIFGGNWNYCGADNFEQKLNGILDDVRIYDRALSEQEIEQLYLMGN